MVNGKGIIIVAVAIALMTYISGILLWAMGKSPVMKLAGNVMLTVCIAAVIGGFGVFHAHKPNPPTNQSPNPIP